MDKLGNHDIKRLDVAFESQVTKDIEEAFGNIYIKFGIVLSTSIKSFRTKRNVNVIVNEDEIISKAICVLIDNLYNDEVQNKVGYCIRALKFMYWEKIRNNMDPNHELYEDVYRTCQDLLDLHEQGDIELSSKKVRENKDIIRRCKKKAKAFIPNHVSGFQKAEKIESQYISNIDRPKIRRALMVCIKKLTKKQRFVFLKSLRKKTQKELAVEMDNTEANISTLLKKARESLSKCLESHGFSIGDITV